MTTRHETRRSDPGLDDLEQRLHHWVGQELISTDQATQILAAELGTHPSPLQQRPSGTTPPLFGSHSGSLVTEALGYVGGILMFIAVGLIAGQYFDDLGQVGRLLATALAALALLAGGALIPMKPDRPPAGRLRSVLWTLTVAVVAGFLGLLGDETLGWKAVDVTLLAAGGAALVGAELWRRHRWPLQQAAVIAALAVTVGAAVAGHLAKDDIAVSGLAVWGLGGVWLLLGWAGHVGPRYASDFLGGAVVTVGSQLSMEQDWGSGLAAATAAALIITGVRLKALVLLGVGSFATLLVAPAVMSRYFPDTLAAPLALLGAGLVLVAAAVATAARVRKGGAKGNDVRPMPGTGWPAVIGFATVVAAVVFLLSWT